MIIPEQNPRDRPDTPAQWCAARRVVAPRYERPRVKPTTSPTRSLRRWSRAFLLSSCSARRRLPSVVPAPTVEGSWLTLYGTSVAVAPVLALARPAGRQTRRPGFADVVLDRVVGGGIARIGTNASAVADEAAEEACVRCPGRRRRRRSEPAPAQILIPFSDSRMRADVEFTGHVAAVRVDDRSSRPRTHGATEWGARCPWSAPRPFLLVERARPTSHAI